MTALAPLLTDNEPQRQQRFLARHIATEQKTRVKRGRRLGETLVSLGYLTEQKADKIQARQQKTGKPFGRIAIEHGYVDSEAIQVAIGIQYGFLRDTGRQVKLPDSLHLLRDPHGVQAEKIRLMRTRLLTACDNELLSTISLIDVGRHRSSVDLAVNLATAFAQVKRNVLLIDASLRTPALDSLLAINNVQEKTPGLNDFLSEKANLETVIQPAIVNHLDLIFAGKRTPNPQVLLSGERLNMLIDQAKPNYDTILLISNRFGPIADGQFVWRLSSAAIVSARKNKTRESELKQLAATLYDLNTPVLGAVLATGS